MNWLNTFSNGLRSLGGRRAVKQEIDEELRFHIEQRTAENLAAGMSPDEAARAARKRFGNVQSVREECRDVRGASFGETTLQDVRFGLRMLLKSPGFTAVALLTLAIGIGATTAIFGVMNAYLLDPVPLRDGRRLVEINEVQRARQNKMRVSPPLYHDLLGQRQVFEKVVSFNYDAIEVAGGEFLERLLGCQITQDFFDVFQVPPQIGCWFAPESADENVVLISHALWQSHFGGDRNVIGRQLKSGNVAYTVIGVMPASFQFPSRYTQYWRPFHFKSSEFSEVQQRYYRNYWTVARLAPGVSQKQAQAALDTLAQRCAADYPEQCREYTIKARPLRDFFVAPDLQNSLWSVALAIGLILLIVCANLANLQLARAESRLKETSVRLALGATRWRIIRQLLTESVILSLAAGAGAVVLAIWLRQLLELMLPSRAPVLRSAGLDLPMLVWTFLISAACGIAFGLFPAWRAGATRLNDTLKEAGTTASAGASHTWFRHSLVVVEIALAVVLLSGAGLMIRSVSRLLRTDPGLDPKNLAGITIVPYDRFGDQAARAAMVDQVAARLAALPGTTAVGAGGVSGAVLGSDFHLLGRAEPVNLSWSYVGAGQIDCFKTIGARLKEGRWFEKSDDQDGQYTVIVNESLATLCWPGQSAIGKRLYQGPNPNTATSRNQNSYYEVVGVVHDLSDWNVEAKATPAFFVPAGQMPRSGVQFCIRTTLDPASLLAGVRQISKELFPNSLPPTVHWVERELYASTEIRRMFMGFLSAFAGVGMLLATLGVFAVLTQAVIRRTREIGVRMALGARPGDVLRMIVGQGMRLTCAGILIGLAGAFALTRLLEHQLYQISATDLPTFIAAPLLLFAAALPACWLPARRAAKVDPMVALRYE